MGPKGLIFIPDISGFTRFVKEAEIAHSQLIIKELLEIIIDANDSGLQISEIEGDAVLFYKFGERPSPDQLYQQVERMFSAFHTNLISYEKRRFCQCEACLSAVNLTLKVITHYGEFTEYKVKGFDKLIGKDVILAHQLLKNDIDTDEYWLVTNELLAKAPLPQPNGKRSWLSGVKQNENIITSFNYLHLGFIKDGITVDPIKRPEIGARTKLINISDSYETDIISLLHAVGDFTNRNRWMHGVESVEVQNHFLPRVGMRCTMKLENKMITLVANHYYFSESAVEFSEIDEHTGHLYFYKIEKISNLKSRITVAVYASKVVFPKVFFIYREKVKLKKWLEFSFRKLVTLIDEIGDSVRKKSEVK